MKYIIAAIMLLPIVSFAQPANDVFKDIWNDTSLPDSTREKAFIEFTISNRAILPDTILKYADQAYQHGIETGSKNFICYALCFKSSYLFTIGEYTKAIQLFDSCLVVMENSNDYLLQALVNYGLGYAYINKSEYVKSLYYAQKGLSFAEKSGNTKIIAIAYNVIAIYYYEVKNYNTALEYWELALKTNPDISQFDKAVIAMNKGNAYTELKQYKKGLENFTEAMEIAETSGNTFFTALIYYNMAETYDELGAYDTAISYNTKSIALSKSINNKLLIGQSYLSLSSVYNHMKDHRSAIRFATVALENNQEDGDINVDKQIYEQLYIANKALGNSKEALRNYEQMIKLKDSIYNEENTKTLTRLEMQNAFDKSEAANKAAQEKKDALALKELQRQKVMRNSFIGGFAIVLLFAGVFFRQRNNIKTAKMRSDNLLLNILPEEIADELKTTGKARARHFDNASILFTDFKQFTVLSESFTAEELVEELNICFEAFDAICEKYKLEKIKTIGDAYMAAGGMPVPVADSVKNTIMAGIEMQQFIQNRKKEKTAQGKHAFEMRAGINTGPVVAGIVGVKKFQYDVWGDTVNTANRIEEQCETGKVNISQSTYELVKNETDFVFTKRGKISVKGKGEIEMYYAELA